jgi:hypothetical protein
MSNIAAVKDKVSYKVIDNYLTNEQFNTLYDYISDGKKMAWFLQDTVAYSYEKDNDNIDFYFTHTVYLNNKPNSDVYDILLDSILQRLNPKALIRIKCNLYTNIGTLYKNTMHVDYDFKHKGALFFLTDCNAPTILADGTEIKSVKNRMLLFDPSVKHCSSHPTDVKQRFTINFNYF